MTAGAHNRGGTPVGAVRDLEPAGALAVLYLRLWADGERGRNEIAKAVARGLGEREAEAALRAFETLFELCRHYGRRRIAHHQVSCGCLGSDEACFANFVLTAAEGDHEDAMWMATLIVRADAAPMLVGQAGEVGLWLRRLALRIRPDPEPPQEPKTLH